MSDGKTSAKLVLLCFAVMYSGLSVLAIIRTWKMYKTLTVTRYAQVFYVACCVESVFRAFTLISIVIDIENIEYTVLFVLVTLPDSLFILIYLLLLIIAAKIYYQAHLDTNLLVKSAKKPTKFIASAVLIIASLFLIQLVSYLIYITQAITSITISNENAYINIIIPVLGIGYILYLDIIFSGIPTKSPVWKGNLHRIIYICIFWTISRIIKGVLDLLDQSSIVSIVDAVVDPAHSSATLFKSALCIAVIIVAELICLYLVYDYAFLGIFVMDEGTHLLTEKFQKSMVAENPFVSSEDLQVIEELTDLKKKPLGKTYKAYHRGEVVFYRVMGFTRISAYVSEEITKEIESYKGLTIAGIVPVIGIIFQAPTVGLIYPYFPQGSLFSLIHSKKTLPLSQKLQILLEISESLVEIHESNRSHGHLTSHNILLTPALEPLISDLGFHKMKKYAGLMYGYDLKSAWSSPEILKDKKKVPKVFPADDCYSFGIISWELFTQQVPFQGLSKKQLIESVGKQGYRPLIPQTVNEVLSKLIKSCWNEDPQKRTDMKEIAGCLRKSCFDLC